MTALAQVPFITTRPGHWLRTLADQLFTTAGLKPTIACQGDEPTAIRPLISAGLGVGLLPESSRQSTTHPPVAWLHLNTRDARRTLTLAWRTDTYLSTAAQHFRDLAVERLRTTAQSRRLNTASTLSPRYAGANLRAGQRSHPPLPWDPKETRMGRLGRSCHAE